MERDREMGPESARDAAAFIELLQRLKDESGLSYRQLEERAASRGEVLARSTIADALRRRALPRPEVLAAFVRACGAGEDLVRDWLAARERLARARPETVDQDAAPADQVPAAPAAPKPFGAETVPSARRPRLLGPLGAAALALLVLLAVAVWALWPDGGDDARDRATSAATGPAPAAAFREGWVEIRPATAPELCLTEGRERTGQYQSAVAVQRPCADATPPRTYLRAAGDGLYYIEWDHPRMGRGCLTLLVSGPAAGMLEPWLDCGGDRASQQFRIEPVDMPAGAFRIRPDHSGLCMTINGAKSEGVEAVQEPCTGDKAQRFLITPLG